MGSSQNQVNSIEVEIKKVLEDHEGRLGEIYRESEKEKVKSKIAKKFGTMAYNYLTYIDVILGKKAPNAPSLAIQSARAINGLLKSPAIQFSRETQKVLEERRDECFHLSEDPGMIAKQIDSDAAANSEVGGSSIYAYTLPHYRDKPYIDLDNEKIMKNRTMIKVGMTTQKIDIRLQQQKTGLPEDPVLLYVWKVSDSNNLKSIERKIHQHLIAIGHTKKEILGGGAEWFLTNEETLLSTADLLGLELTFHHHYPESDRDD